MSCGFKRTALRDSFSWGGRGWGRSTLPGALLERDNYPPPGVLEKAEGGRASWTAVGAGGNAEVTGTLPHPQTLGRAAKP